MRVKSPEKLLRNPHFWIIILVFLTCSILHYPRLFLFLGGEEFNSLLGLERHAIERILFLVPISYAAFILGIKGGIGSLIAALIIMLPRVFFISLYPRDALFETCITISVGTLINWWFEFRRKEAGQKELTLKKLETVKNELQSYVRVIGENEKRLSALHSIATMVNQSLILDEVLEVAADKIEEVMDIDVILIFFLDKEAKQLELRAHRNIYAESASEVTGLKVGEGSNGWVAQTGKPCFVEDITQDAGLLPEVMKREGIRSVFIVPLKSKDKVIGTFCVATYVMKQFTLWEKELLTHIGIELGVAAEKAYFCQELQRIGESFREIFEKAHDAIWIQDLSGKIIDANQAASQLTGYKLENLIGRNITQFFTPEGYEMAREVEESLLLGREVSQPYEQHIIRKDGSGAIFMVTTSLLGKRKTPAFLYIVRDITDERRLQENLRLYANQIIRAHEEERRRIARELHDDTIQTMIAFSRRLDIFISKNLALSNRTLKHLEELQKDIDESLMGIRRFVQDLRPPILEYLGIIPALRELAAQMKCQSGTEVNVKIDGLEQHFSPEEGITIYRIAQEALRNTWKHSGAIKADLSICFDEETTTIVVSDEGKGFNVKGSSHILEAGKLGLMGMNERARLLGGTLDIYSEPNLGTTVILSIPHSGMDR